MINPDPHGLTTLLLDEEAVDALLNITDAADALVVAYEDAGDPDDELSEDVSIVYSLMGVNHLARREERLRDYEQHDEF